MTTDVNDFLMSGGVASFKFENINDQVTGEIESAEVRNQTDMKTKEPKFWPDGNPMRQLVVTLLGNEFNDDDDDGRRQVFIKGQMASALRDAVRKSGERGIANGGKLSVKLAGVDEPTTPGFSGQKQYQVWYQAPPPQEIGVGGDENPFGDGDHPADDPRIDDVPPF